MVQMEHFFIECRAGRCRIKVRSNNSISILFYDNSFPICRSTAFLIGLSVDIKGTVARDFRLLVFFHESVSPQLLSISLGPFLYFSKIRGDIRSSRLTTSISLTYRQRKKNQNNFNNFVGTPLDSRVNIYINFCLQVHFKVSAA
jgi:hypothetical protein